MTRSLPAEAVGYYLNLGPARSYQAVATHFGVTKRTVTAAAVRERWQDRLADYERTAREKIGERFVKTLEEANERHVKVGRFLQSVGLSAIQSAKVVGAVAGLRAIKVGVELERLGLGEPTQRVELSEADAVRRTFAQCIVSEDDDEDAPQAPEGAAAGAVASPLEASPPTTITEPEGDEAPAV